VTTKNHPSRTLHQNSSPVKAQIVGAGVSLGQLAEAAGISPSYLTQFLSGKRRSAKRQRDIFIAFRALSGLDIYIDEFWGSLLHPGLRAGYAILRCLGSRQKRKRKSKIAS